MWDTFKNFFQSYKENVTFERKEWKQFLITYLLVLLLYIIRRHDVITNPQFFYEDGLLFFMEQLLYGSKSVFYLYANYVHLIPRLIATSTDFLDFNYLPLFFNLNAIFWNVLVYSFFSLPYFRHIVKNDLLRSFACIFITIAPVAFIEMHGNITNIHNSLPILFFLLTFAGGTLSKKESIFLFILSLLIIFTSPAALIFVPFLLLRGILFFKRLDGKLFLFSFLIGITYTIFLKLNLDTKQKMDFNIVHVFLALQGSIVSFLFNFHDGFSIQNVIKYYNYSYIVIILFFIGIVYTTKQKGLIPIIFLGLFLMSIIFPIVARSLLKTIPFNEAFMKQLNIDHITFMKSQILVILYARYGFSGFAFFIFLIFIFLDSIKTTRYYKYIAGMIFVILLYQHRGSILLDSYIDYQWKNYREAFINKEPLSIPINPPGVKIIISEFDWQLINMRKNDQK